MEKKKNDCLCKNNKISGGEREERSKICQLQNYAEL